MHIFQLVDDFHELFVHQAVYLLFEANNQYLINVFVNFLQEIMISHYQDQEMNSYQMVLNDELVE